MNTFYFSTSNGYQMVSGMEHDAALAMVQAIRTSVVEMTAEDYEAAIAALLGH